MVKESYYIVIKGTFKECGKMMNGMEEVMNIMSLTSLNLVQHM